MAAAAAAAAAAAPVPVAISPLSLSALLNYVLTTQSDSTSTLLLICSRRETFLYALQRSLDEEHSGATDSLQRLIAPTLHNLVTARHIHAAFCASVQALLAYLTAYGVTRDAADAPKENGRIVLVNPLALHAATPSFSAQGLSRTFAAAAEAALTLRAQLLVVECLGAEKVTQVGAGVGGEGDDVAAGAGPVPSETEGAVQDPWEQEVPILNVSARRYRSGGAERVWAGRTVKVKRIAARWFKFVQSETWLAVVQ